MYRCADVCIRIADFLSRQNHIALPDQRLANSSEMLAEHYGNGFNIRAGLYLAVAGKLFSLRRMNSAGKRKSAYGIYFHP